MGVHIKVKSSGLRKFILITTVHFLHNGSLSMHHLIVGEGEQIMFIIKIVHGKGELMIKLCPLGRSCLKVGERVIHPSQIPFIIKTKAVLRYGCGNTGIGSGIFGNQQRMRKSFL